MTIIQAVADSASAGGAADPFSVWTGIAGVFGVVVGWLGEFLRRKAGGSGP